MSIIDQTWATPANTYDYSQGFTIDENKYPRSGAASYATPFLQALLGGYFGAPKTPTAQTTGVTAQPVTTAATTVPASISQPATQQSGFQPYYVSASRLNAIKNYNLPSDLGGAGYQAPLNPLGGGYGDYAMGITEGQQPINWTQEELKPWDIPAGLGEAVLAKLIPGYDVNAAWQYYLPSIANTDLGKQMLAANQTEDVTSNIPAGTIPVSDAAGNIIGYQDVSTGQPVADSTGQVYTGGSSTFDETAGTTIDTSDPMYWSSILGGGPASALETAINNLTNAPELIEAERQGMLERYWNEVPEQMNQNVTDLINQLAQKGVLSSTVAGTGLNTITKEIAQGAQKAQTEADVWAAGEKYQNLMDTVQALVSQNTLLNQLFGATQESTNELAPTQLALQTLLGLSAI